MQYACVLGGLRLALVVLVLSTSGCLPFAIVSRTAKIEHVDAKTTKVTLYRKSIFYGITIEGVNFCRIEEYPWVVTDADSVFMPNFMGKTYRLNVSRDSGLTGSIGYLAIDEKEDHVYMDIRVYRPCWYGGLEGFESSDFNGEFKVKKVDKGMIRGRS